MLVVEDEPLIAVDIEMLIEDAGHRVMATAASLRQVEGLPSGERPDVAFVDMQLAENSTGIDVNRLIQERWPETVVVFVTANPKKIPDDFDGAHGVISKPFSSLGFTAAIKYLQEALCEPPPVSSMPGSFIASDRIAALWTKHMAGNRGGSDA